ncbi:glycoside hydrolase family 3 C-terminal domain-containing protein [Ideonella sp. 4Y16]|uniref:glycoside hydrolase family 3 N-terminal domain-containing protein n=1 Tax=Ideonella alba TaxID=2824118 RepID=UPI001B37CAD2|nr:glycoside hydrolase family 3 N-terminal domain-containing protein [Ideonella alba]MBQ0943317.1 glycoside hydrolase family 3 C-terminal domain-containing protein [Ideonella alba]
MSPPRLPLRRRFLQAAAALLAARSAAARPTAKDDAAIERLLRRMTLEEKAGQLSLFFDDAREDAVNANPAQVERAMADIGAEIAAGRVGGLFNGIGVASGWALQRIAVERSRLGIPLLFAADVIHGLRTVFPVPLGEAAAFDTALAERTARAAAEEATAVGIHWTFAPMVDVARDQRWGRVVEGAGEDTWWGQQLAAARVRGFQGRSLRDDDSLLATVKHFAGYGAVAGGMDYNSVELSDATLHDVHLPPFRAGLEAGALAVMTAFHDLNGIPATAHHGLLTGVLRQQWGFGGLVVSDFASDVELVTHGLAADDKDAARRAILAGCDMSMASALYNRHLPALVREGAVPMAVLDRSVRRVLRVKQALGLFERPYRSLDPTRERSALRRPQTVALAREAARRSVVLLKNEGRLLPLPAQGQRIALIGPFAQDRVHLMGPWALWNEPAQGVSLEDGLRAALADPAALQVVPGCGIETALDGGIAAAVAAARAADVVILSVGESDALSGESASRTDIGLPPVQQALAEAVAATGTPMVVVLQHGRALALSGAVRAAPAILAGWYLGQQSGHALADLLLGQQAPSGRLPVSFPQASGQQPYFYNHRNTGRPQERADETRFRSRYLEVTNEALYPFGHGLGYGEIVYEALSLDTDTLAWDGRCQVRVQVRNLGPRAMREVVQLYIHQRVASPVRPVRELRGVQAVELAAGEAASVAFTLSRHDLAHRDAQGRARVEPGWFDLWLAPSAAAGTPVSLRLLGPTPSPR